MEYKNDIDGPSVLVEVDGTAHVYTEKGLIELVQSVNSMRLELAQVERKLKSARFDVKEFFQARFETDSDEIVCEVDDVNNLLANIGSEELARSWSATISITATVTGIEAPSAEAAREIIENNIELNLGVDGDIWLDDMTVESTYPEA
jgi:hypothetical protein